MFTWLLTVDQSKNIKQATTEVAAGRLRQQWSSWQVEEDKIPTSTPPVAASMSSSIEGALRVRERSVLRGNPTSSWRVELVANIVSADGG